MNRTYMLDTRFCAFILREQPEAVLGWLEQAVLRGHRIVISAITWAELSQAAREDSPATQALADAFCASLDVVLPWDRAAVDATTEIKAALAATGTPLGPNDTAIAGHAIAAGAVLVTKNGGEFERVPGLTLQDWAG
ncbi:TPA: PIN domain-containing protein [Klebsiella variicola subsp. variicola]|uniref:PIN domain-containing protein n=1 Tax=Enterobacteriaceae TaxID=543 RepID=UPI0004D97795|nr:PIN domain-containing protein [Citrobacter amalonaticus]KEY49039.1 twitching motility protein PilT [Citrobacter amalonaticus]HCI6825689.1 PIN domain-containing protein [Klebsiella variicola subsp. variicola]HCM7311041.1 PIN domain-containing protein [Klebsiella pneumoniae]